jgi:hypothetical protein
MAYIASEVNSRLGSGEAVTTPVTTTATTTVAVSSSTPSILLQARTTDGTILPQTSWPDYAGWSPNGAIAYLAVNCEWPIRVQAYTKASGWLPELTNPNNISDTVNGCVGDGSAITGLRFYLESPNGDKVAQYRVNCGSGYYDWQRDDETTNGQDGYAGDLVNPIYEVQATIGSY